MALSSIRLTPKQLTAQWRHLPHKFEVNVWTFEKRVAKAAKSVFRGSFDKGRFNSSGSSPWCSRKDRKSHPILNETSSLKNSITWKRVLNKRWGRSVQIYTNPNGFTNSKRHKGFCYAAIHNAPSGTYTYGKNGPSIQRQYIGHSTVLEKQIEQLSPLIFTGFPK